jgi:WD40 repeat protein
LALTIPASATPPQDCQGDPLPDGAVTRLGTTRLRHHDGVCRVAYSPDGKLLASLGRDRCCRVWDAASGKLLHVCQEKDVDYYAVAFAPNSDKLLVAAGDPFHGGNAGLRIIDMKTGLETQRLSGHDQPAYALAFASDGRAAISVSCQQVIRWDLSTAGRVSEWQLRSTAALAISPDRTTLAWVDGETEDLHVHLSDAAAGKEIRKLKGHKRAVVAVAWSPDGRFLASGNPFEPIFLWDPRTGKVLRCFEQQQAGMTLRFSPDGKLLACSCMDGKVRVWDVETGNERPVLTGYHGWVNDLAFSPDSKMLALAGADSQVIHRWDVNTGAEERLAPGHPGQVHALDFAASGRLIASAGGDWHDGERAICLWDPATGKQVRRLQGHSGKVNCLRFSPDGTKLVSGAEREDMFRLWDVTTGKELPQFDHKGADNAAMEARVSAVAWSPDGARILAAHDQGMLILWDAATGKELRTFKGHEGIVHAIAFSPDGKFAVSGSVDRTVRLWDVATGEETGHFGEATDAVHSVAFSADGRLLAATYGDYEGVTCLWDFKTGRQLARFPTSRSRVFQVAFSPDSKLLAGTGPDGALVIWEIATKQERCRFPGHANGGLAVAFAPDGRKIAAGSPDTTVLMWELSHCPEAARPAEADLQRLWDDLGSTEARTAHVAMCALQREPNLALKLLQKRLQPLSALDADRMARALEDLDHERFQVREKATLDLAKLGEMAEPFLRKTLAQSTSLEAKRRVEFLLSRLDTGTLSPGQLRVVRGFELLERLGGPQARELLEAHLRQMPGGRLGEEAQGCLRRLR